MIVHSFFKFKIQNRDAVSYCGKCLETPGCGFCHSSLDCLEYSGHDHDCREWINASSSCPGKLDSTLKI